MLRQSFAQRVFDDESVQDLIQDATILDCTTTHESFSHETSLLKDPYGCGVLTEWNRKDSPEAVLCHGIAYAPLQSSGGYTTAPDAFAQPIADFRGNALYVPAYNESDSTDGCSESCKLINPGKSTLPINYGSIPFGTDHW